MIEDSESIEKELENKIEEKFNTIKNTQYTKILFEFELLGKSLVDTKLINEEDLILPRLNQTERINLELIESLYQKEDLSIPDINLNQYQLLLENKIILSEFLSSCDKLQQIPEGIVDLDLELKELPKDFVDLVSSLCEFFNNEVTIFTLSNKDVIK